MQEQQRMQERRKLEPQMHGQRMHGERMHGQRMLELLHMLGQHRPIFQKFKN